MLDEFTSKIWMPPYLLSYYTDISQFPANCLINRNMIKSLKNIFVVIEVIKMWSSFAFYQYICTLVNKESNAAWSGTMRVFESE